MTIIKNIFIFILVIVILFFIFGDSKYIGTNNNTTLITKIDTFYKHDTFRIYQKGESIPFVVLDTLISLKQVHDTAYILQDYNIIKVYSDTLHIDTTQYVTVKDTISQNKIIGRSFFANLSEKTITIDKIKIVTNKPKNEFYLGLIGDVRQVDNRIGAGVGISYKKQRESYNIIWTTNQFSFGIYKKLF